MALFTLTYKKYKKDIDIMSKFRYNVNISGRNSHFLPAPLYRNEVCIKAYIDIINHLYQFVNPISVVRMGFLFLIKYRKTDMHPLYKWVEVDTRCKKLSRNIAVTYTTFNYVP